MSDYGFSTLNEVRVRQTIATMVADVDLRDFSAAERLFAPRVNVDYTTLWGGEATEMTREALIESWRLLVPGFDATWHELGDIAVKINESTAEATCTVAARHWIGAAVWLPRGQYEFRLTKADTWRISSMRLVLGDEIGSRALVQQAQERLAAVTHAHVRG